MIYIDDILYDIETHQRKSCSGYCKSSKQIKTQNSLCCAVFVLYDFVCLFFYDSDKIRRRLLF